MTPAARLVLLGALGWAAGACANSTTPSGTGRGDGGGAGSDGGAGVDGGGGGGGADAGPAATCTPGAERFCTTECGTRGLITCRADGTAGPCVPPAEDCNGADDDCDGEVDEGIVERACSSECGGGSERCEAGAWSGCTAVAPREEVCDGLDNDCDSMIDEGLTRACSTACGSGTETCVSGGWVGCTAPGPLPETCNGLDDDCDGTVDEGLTRVCTTACGSGVESCSAGSWGGCSAPSPAAESCNGLDDDCDGTVDEGFLALSEATTYTVLTTFHPGCGATTQRMGPECNAAIHRYCSAKACATGGFGPVESSGDVVHVGCVQGEPRSTTYGALAAHHPVCDGSTERMGPNCNAAMHRFCQAAGLASGFGPDESSGSNVQVTCVPAARAEVRTTTYGALASHHAPCNGSTQRWGPDCNAAIHRWCQASGFTTGFGPVENSDTTAVVTCLRP